MNLHNYNFLIKIFSSSNLCTCIITIQLRKPPWFGENGHHWVAVGSAL